MSYSDTKVGERILRLFPNDTGLVPENALPILLDLASEPLRAGDIVAWGTSYRGGGGAVIGRIESVKWEVVKYNAYVIDEAGKYVTEAYTYKDWRGNEQQGNRHVFVERAVWRPRIAVSAISGNRKGRVETDPKFFVKIANQEYGS